MDEPLRRNLELKARLPSLEQAREVAERVSTSYAGIERQTDTYFRAAHGRLKLREIDERGAHLIWYDRPDQTDSKESRYRLVPVAEAAGLREALAAALGIRAVVEKQREIFWRRNVRIHLDRLASGETFLEFEAVLRPDDDPRDAQRELDFLSEQFALQPSQLLAHSYVDMLAEAAPESGV